MAYSPFLSYVSATLKACCSVLGWSGPSIISLFFFENPLEILQLLVPGRVGRLQCC